MTPVLAGHDLYKAFGQTVALRGTSIAVGAAEIVAVMGPSGSGKSTLLHCLAGILTPDAGEVHFAGSRVDQLSDRQRVNLRRTAFGMVFQFGQLVPELPAVENVALPLLLTGAPRRAALFEARGWLARMGLDGIGERMPGELSGGQGQRVALARALVARPRVVFADEPTGALDSFAADQVMELLVETVRDQGTSVLLVTHEPRVAGFADRTVLLRDGVQSVQVTVPATEQSRASAERPLFALSGGRDMIRNLLLGLRLAVAGGREALIRLGFTAAGVAVGVGLVLLALAGPPAASGRTERNQWQHAESALRTTDFDTADDPTVEAPDGALFLVVSDSYDAVPIVRAYVAALGDEPPVSAGLDRLPGPGEIALSPALRRLLASTPDGDLAGRFPGRDTLTIGPEGLAHDGELVAIIGQAPEQLGALRSAREVRGFYRYTPLPPGWILNFASGAIAVGAVLVLAPVFILIIVVTRVAWRQRQQRLAAIRLVGATGLQIAVVAAAETGLAALAGTGLGWVAYEVGRRVIAATVIFQGGHFWLDDLAVPPRLLAAVLVGTPLLVMLTTIVSLRHVYGSALPVQRRASRPPSRWNAVPLTVGLAGQFALLPFRDQMTNTEGDGPTPLATLATLLTVLTLVGFVLIGPWIVMLVGRGIAGVTRGVPGLLAARRIAADPYATFRSVSAVVLAATAVTFSGSIVTTSTPPDDDTYDNLRRGVIEVHTGGASEEQVRPLLTGGVVALRSSGSTLIVRCVDLARVRADVQCPFTPSEQTPMIEPGPSTGPNLIVSTLYIPTDGSVAAESRVRTAVARVLPNALANSERAPVQRDFSAYFADYDRLFRVAAVFVLIVGAFGLTTAMLGGLIERRRPFALLRASGVRLSELRRAVFLETAATMAIASAAGAAVGLVLAYATVALSSADWRWPGLDVLYSVTAGVVAALLFSMLALPMLSLTTRHDAIRYE